MIAAVVLLAPDAQPRHRRRGPDAPDEVVPARRPLDEALAHSLESAGRRGRMLQVLGVGRGQEGVVAADREEELELGPRGEAREPADRLPDLRIEGFLEDLVGTTEDVLLRQDDDLRPEPERLDDRLNRVAHMGGADEGEPGDELPLPELHRETVLAHEPVRDEVDAALGEALPDEGQRLLEMGRRRLVGADVDAPLPDRDGPDLCARRHVRFLPHLDPTADP
jgi:hypothetical protein